MLLWVLFGSNLAVAQPGYPQASRGSGAPRISDAANSKIVHDPTTGKSYQQRIAQVTLPTTGWELKTRTQKYFQPVVYTVLETRQKVVYTPRQTQTLQHQQRGKWNPFVDPYYRYHYAPTVEWVPSVQQYQVPVQKREWVESAISHPNWEWRLR